MLSYNVTLLTVYMTFNFLMQTRNWELKGYHSCLIQLNSRQGIG